MLQEQLPCEKILSSECKSETDLHIHIVGGGSAVSWQYVAIDAVWPLYTLDSIAKDFTYTT